MGEDTRQTDTSTDNKGRLELSGAREPIGNNCVPRALTLIFYG